MPPSRARPLLTRLTFLLDILFSSGYSFDIYNSSSQITSNSVYIQSIFLPLWDTTYLERAGFACSEDFEGYSKRFPEYTSHFYTSSTPWNRINPNTWFLTITCIRDFKNPDFEKDIQRGALGNYTKLEYLSIMYCQLHNISDISENLRVFKGLSRLSILLLYHNYGNVFSFKVFDDLPSIKWIGMNDNKWNTMHWSNFCHNQKLEYITQENNSISEIKITKLINDTCTELRINSLALAGNPLHMEEGMFEPYNMNGVLNIASCSIKKINASYFYGLEELQDIDIQGNLLVELPPDVFSSMKGLIRIRLNDNKLTSLDVDNLFAKNHLESLRLENNRISYINGSFSNMTLTELDLANNSLTHISKYQFGGMKNLRSLNLSSNMIDTIEKGTFNDYFELESLDLSYNQLRTIHSFNGPKLRHFSLHSNLLSVIQRSTFKDMFSLQTLEIQDNSLTGSATFELFTCSLTYFDMSYNNYTGVNITVNCSNRSNDANIFTFNASHNELSNIFIYFPNTLQILLMNFNKIQSFLHISPLTHLQELHLRNNKLTEVPCNMAIGSDNMTILNLGDNVISKVCRQGFTPIKTLYALYLDKNLLDTFDQMNVSKLYLSDNPLTCSCENEPLKKWLLSNSSPKITDNITCITRTQSRKDIIRGIPNNCNNELLVRTILTSVASSVAFILIMCLIAFKYRYEIQVIAFYKWNIRLGKIGHRATYERRNYKYDAFICFAEEDLQFVTSVILSYLEPTYKLCIYHRDFPVGEDIADAILDTIEESALTIVVLSCHFMQSRWGRFEFKQAHYNSMRHGNQKLLIVVIDNSVLQQDLDLTLKSILFSKAYLRSDDVLFKEKLLHAMPTKERDDVESNSVADVEPLLP